MSSVLGLHHVTAIASDPQHTLDFYGEVLGLRLVKRTVNFDDPYTYHLYFGNETGTPGTLMTFFAWPGAPAGRQGAGQVAVTAFAVLPAAIGFWVARLLRYGIRYEGPTRRGSGADAEQVLAFRDPDGLMLEIVAHRGAEARPARGDAPGVPREESIHGLYGVTLWAERARETERVLLDTLGFREIREEGTTRRYAVGDGGPGTLVDIREIGGFVTGASGPGTVHHVAFAVPDADTQLAVRDRVQQALLHPTRVIDRSYFQSVYFREPGGVLFELATHPPGFAIDEPVEHLGEALELPPQWEPLRAAIEAALPPIHLHGPTPASAFFADLARPADAGGAADSR